MGEQTSGLPYKVELCTLPIQREIFRARFFKGAVAVKRDIQKLFTDERTVAFAATGDDWPRGLLSAFPVPAKWFALLIKADGQRRLVPAGDDPRPERSDRLVLVRDHSFPIPLSVAGCSGIKGNLIDGACEILVRWQPRADDLAALERSLLSTPLSLERLTDLVADGGGLATLRQFIQTRSAEQLLHEDLRDELSGTLRDYLKRLAFETGLEIESVGKVKFSSEMYEERSARERETQRRVERLKAAQLVEEAALAATKRRLGDLGQILEQLKSAAAGDEKSRWHQLLPALAPADRNRLLENLWRLTPDRHVAESVAVLAGRECLWLDPADSQKIVRRLEIPAELGGLRSITYASERHRLMIGAASGVWALDAATGAVADRYAVPNASMPRTGFNAAVVTNDRLYATNSELGCWSWLLDDPAVATPILQPENGVPKRVRAALATDDGRVLFAADDCIYAFESGEERLGVICSGPDVIHALAALENTLFVSTADGKLFWVDLHHPDDWWVMHQAREPIETIQPRRWADLIELVIPLGKRGVAGVYDTEGVVTTLLEAATPIRRAWACDDLVVGMNSLRDRLIVMNANLPERTGREAKIAQITGHEIQDACIVLAPVKPSDLG